MTQPVLFALLVAALHTQPAAGLRIVVIEGEDAVNVIQQKTAVAPVVEVRDRNNLPVAGATVTFTIGGNTASFAGGVQTLTVATNAAGQAAAAGVSPLASGAVQIQVTAAFQGQTAVATIAQTNVLTAGAAGATGASGASGTAAGGGGGISGTTLGIVGAAVAGGAVAATQLGGDEGDGAGQRRSFSGAFSGQLLWSFTGCARVHNMSGTLTITLGSTEGQVSGTAELTGTGVIESGNCTSGPQPGTSDRLFMSPTPLGGAAPNVTFSYQASNPVPGTPTTAPSTHTVSFSFTGTLAGDVINGMLTHGEKAETAGFAPGTGTATYPVTLRR